MEFTPNMAVFGPEGWEPMQIKAEQPATTYAEFKREILNEIARCLNMPYNVAACNSSGYNYSSGRLDHQTYYKSVRVEQDHLEDVVLDRILYMWLAEAVQVYPELAALKRSATRTDASGLTNVSAVPRGSAIANASVVVSISEGVDVLEGVIPAVPHQWFWDGREHIDPAKEANAQATSSLGGCSGKASTITFVDGDGRPLNALGMSREQEVAKGDAWCMAHGQGNAEIATDHSPTLSCNHEAPILAQVVGPLCSHSPRHGHAMTTQQAAEAGHIVTHPLTARYDSSPDGTGRGVPIVPTTTTAAVHSPDLRDTGHDADPCNVGRNAEHDTNTHYAVRRLTPRECERLQDFPDDYTLIDYRGKPAADGPRYRALGNSMAVPVVAWIGQRIEMMDRLLTALRRNELSECDDAALMA